ncbi:WhiB family transcriptional regulator [Streptomyces sp. NPDC096132]|uniref:WhiB family transcriptional regulator n=1 Tax=Streptomyces sp. NPDC096132 TaxID=3366075 RepID=UPI00380B0977
MTAWRTRAACAGQDTELWFPDYPVGAPAMKICGRCPVRAECLYDCLADEVPSRRYGIRGGLTTGERQALPELPERPSDAIAVLRELLHTTSEDQPPAERTGPTMTTDTELVAQAKTEDLPVGQLLKWGDEHPDADVRDQAARARLALTGLRRRHVADQELAAITTEAEQLEKRLAELQARKAELVPAKPKRKTPARDYDTRTVRAWADEQGVECPRVGQIPKRVLDAWRASLLQAG